MLRILGLKWSEIVLKGLFYPLWLSWWWDGCTVGGSNKKVMLWKMADICAKCSSILSKSTTKQKSEFSREKSYQLFGLHSRFFRFFIASHPAFYDIFLSAFNDAIQIPDLLIERLFESILKLNHSQRDIKHILWSIYSTSFDSIRKCLIEFDSVW